MVVENLRSSGFPPFRQGQSRDFSRPEGAYYRQCIAGSQTFNGPFG